MKGLEEYIAKHGRHFTVELAYAATDKYWTAEEIDEILQRKVYYNVSGYKMGDIVFIFNGWMKGKVHKKKRAEDVRRVLGDSCWLDTPTVFELWCKRYGGDFDYTLYI